MKKRIGTFITMVMLGLAISVLLCACGKSNMDELIGEQKNRIMSQCIENNELYYTNYLESKWFVSGEIFDVEKQEDAIYVYAYLSEEMFAPFKGRAYLLCGSNIPVKLTLEPETLKLIKKELPEDGDSYERSLKELFTKEAYRKCAKFDPADLNKDVEEQAKAEWNVEIDDDYQLAVDEDGNYEITVIDNDGSDGKPFECHIEEKGTLERLK